MNLIHFFIDMRESEHLLSIESKAWEGGLLFIVAPCAVDGYSDSGTKAPRGANLAPIRSELAPGWAGPRPSPKERNSSVMRNLLRKGESELDHDLYPTHSLTDQTA